MKNQISTIPHRQPLFAARAAAGRSIAKARQISSTSSTAAVASNTTSNNQSKNQCNAMCQNISYEPTVSSSLTPFGECLHCSLPPVDNDSVQVACDDCSSFICNVCHWCHEYQANHEIRVCDRCDAFYCRSCDEMDQCEDCNEVVCGNCSTLMSCKFCGCGLCEDCATACGR